MTPGSANSWPPPPAYPLPPPLPPPVDANHPTVSSNYMPGELYFDLGGHFDLSQHSQLYFKVDNVTNQNPGNAYSFGPSNQSPSLNPALYDVLGRFYHIGFRINN